MKSFFHNLTVLTLNLFFDLLDAKSAHELTTVSTCAKKRKKKVRNQILIDSQCPFKFTNHLSSYVINISLLRHEWRVEDGQTIHGEDSVKKTKKANPPDRRQCSCSSFVSGP